MPYANIHNKGGEISHKERASVLNFKKVDQYRPMGKNGKMTSFMGARFSSKKGASFSQKVSIGAYKTKMPKREFLGKSQRLTINIKSTIIKEMNLSLKGK